MRKLDLRPARWLVLSGLVAGACLASGSAHAEPTGTASSPIVGGMDASPSDTFAPSITFSDGSFCSGVLVDPRIVLTAAHCVTSGLVYSAPSANDISACILGTTVGPLSAVVKFGTSSTSTQTVTSESIFVDPDSSGCNHDIAAIVLPQAVTGIATPSLLLDTPTATGPGPASPGTSVTSYGWGQTLPDMANRAGTLQLQQGTIVSNSGGTAKVPSGGEISPPVPPGYVLTDVQSCYGDSGGPLIAPGFALVGVFNGILGLQDIESGSEKGETLCGDVVSYYSPPWVNEDFIVHVFQSIGKMPTRVGSPPPVNLGEACTKNEGCNSNYCVTVAGVGVCSKPCASTSDCSGSLVCVDIGADAFALPDAASSDGGAVVDSGPPAASATSVCLAPTGSPKAESCAALPGSPEPSAGWLAGLAVAGLAGRRRHRKEKP